MSDELAALVAEQQRDAAAQRAGVMSERRHRHHELDDERAVVTRVHTEPRLAGDELREHVQWAAWRTLDAVAGRELDRDDDLVALAIAAGLDPNACRAGAPAEPRGRIERRANDAGAAAILSRLSAAFEDARSFVEREGIRSPAAVELAHHVDALTRAEPSPMMALRRTVSSQRVRSPLVRAPREPLIVTWTTGRARAASRSPRTVIADHAHGIASWFGRSSLTDPQLAAVSLVLGNWPPDVSRDEEIPPSEVWKLERAAMKNARKRRHGAWC